jgi:hypothetical protein
MINIKIHWLFYEVPNDCNLLNNLKFWSLVFPLELMTYIHMIQLQRSSELLISLNCNFYLCGIEKRYFSKKTRRN